MRRIVCSQCGAYQYAYSGRGCCVTCAKVKNAEYRAQLPMAVRRKYLAKSRLEKMIRRRLARR